MTENRTSRIYGEVLTDVAAYIPAKNLHVSRIYGEVLISLAVIPDAHASRIWGEVLVDTGAGLFRRRQGQNF